MPYISEAGERGPFVNANARAGFTGLSLNHGYPDLVRAVAEGLGHAMRDCYGAMGKCAAVRAATDRRAARSKGLRGILSAAIHAPVRVSQREEAGAAGAAMMAAVAIGAYPDMQACIAEWVTPLLGCQAEPPDPRLAAAYDGIFPLLPPHGAASSPHGRHWPPHVTHQENRMTSEPGMIDLFRDRRRHQRCGRCERATPGARPVGCPV